MNSYLYIICPPCSRPCRPRPSRSLCPSSPVSSGPNIEHRDKESEGEHEKDIKRDDRELKRESEREIKRKREKKGKKKEKEK